MQRKYGVVLCNNESFFWYRLEYFYICSSSLPDNCHVPISPQWESSFHQSVYIGSDSASRSENNPLCSDISFVCFPYPPKRRLFPKMLITDSHFRYKFLPWVLKLWSVEYEYHMNAFLLTPTMKHQKTMQRLASQWRRANVQRYPFLIEPSPRVQL